MRAQYRNPAPESEDAPTLRLTVVSLEGDAPSALTACSVCLRVLHGSDWVDAETVIRELRSFDLATAPRLGPALCDRCVRPLRGRRARPEERLAA
jgi:hypothetical protein